jgi:hypothetical protein
MMPKYAKIYSSVTNFKKHLTLNIDTVAWWTVNKTENSKQIDICTIDLLLELEMTF